MKYFTINDIHFQFTSKRIPISFHLIKNIINLMKQIFRAANYVRTLDNIDFRILKGIELGMRRFEFVPVEQIKFYARVPQDEAQFRLDNLHKNGLLQRNSLVGYIGYQLISESYDILALHTLVEKDIIISIGDPIGRGKESDVFYTKRPDNTQVCIKIHRIGHRLVS